MSIGIVYVYETSNSFIQFFFVCIPIEVFYISLNFTAQNKFLYDHYSYCLINKSETNLIRIHIKEPLMLTCRTSQFPNGYINKTVRKCFAQGLYPESQEMGIFL